MRLVDGMRAVIGWSMNALGMSGYNATNPRRKILQPSRRPSQATANELASSSLPLLRAYGRDLERNNPTARGAVDGTTALVVGSGIALEPEGWDELGEKRQAEVIELVRAEWMHWCETCTVDGRCLDELESQGWREQFITGEALWRLVMLNERERKGDIPLAVLPLESEWFDDNGAISFRPGPGDTVEVGALTLDKYGRMISARIKNPEMTSVWPAEQVPASALVHIFEKRRSMQSRGESWFAPVIETLQQERDLVDAELAAAVNTSSIGVVVTSEVHDNLDTTESGNSEDPAASLRLGGFTRLYPGDDIKSFANERPTQLINNFRAGLRGDTAAALRCPQRFLDRDPSRANYSSMRSDGNDTERLLGPVREWYGHATAGRLYREVLPFICAKVGVPMPKRVKYRLLPDGNPYVNPKEDIEAAILAIRSGLSTWEIEIGKRGGDAKKMLEQLEKELNEPLLQSIFSADGGPADPNATDPADPNADPSAAGKAKPEEEGVSPADRAAFMSEMRSILSEGRQSPQPTQVTLVNETRMDAASAEIMGRAIAENTKQAIINVPQAAAPDVHVNVEAAQVRMEAMPAPQVTVNVPQAAAPIVNVSASPVAVENNITIPQKTVKAIPQRDGSVLMETQE